MKISVLICTYMRKKLLENCLGSLIDKSIELPDEIIIVDGEGGKIREVIEKWQEKFPNLKMIPTKNVNLATSRNMGLPFCFGDIIALTDDDVKVSPDWIKKMKQLHKEHPEAGAVGGKVKPTGSKLIDIVADIVIFPFGEKAGYVRTVAGANASYKKEAIEGVGTYDESLFRGEDVDYNWRIGREGYKIYCDPDLRVEHQHRDTWKKLLSQVFMYGGAYYLVRRKWKDMYCVYPHHIKGLKDLGKILYFFLGMIFEPLVCLKKIKGVCSKMIVFPLLVVCHSIWKVGMIVEAAKYRALR